VQRPRENSRLDRAIERLTHAGGTPALRGWRGSASRKTTGGRCFALLAPRSLRPSGHLRCASSTPPGVSVVSAYICGEAAIIRDAAARLRFGTTRRSSLQLERSALPRGSAIVCLGRRALRGVGYEAEAAGVRLRHLQYSKNPPVNQKMRRTGHKPRRTGQRGVPEACRRSLWKPKVGADPHGEETNKTARDPGHTAA